VTQSRNDKKTPLLKREISFSSFSRKPKPEKGRKPAKQPKPEAQATTAVAPAQPAKFEAPAPKHEPSLLRREVSLSRKPTFREVVGLKVGASQLAAARIDNHDGLRLLQLERQPLPPGIVSSGEVRDVPALGAALDEFFRSHNLPRRGVRLGLATSRIGVRTVEIAGVDDERQLANAVLFRAHEALSIPVDQAVIDHHVIGESVDEGGIVNRRILLVVAYRESIDRFVAASKLAKIELMGIDLEAFALLRALSPNGSNGNARRAAVVAVNVGHDRTTLAVSDGEICQFTRVLEWGGANLVAAVARELRMQPLHAEQLMREVALTPAQVAPESEDNRIPAAADVARRELQTLARELVASLEFYQAQAGSLPIAEVLLAGGTTRVPGLTQELERLTRVRVRSADPLARVTVANEFEPGEDLASLAVAIGLGVND
jgi:type IV pilus assembly protein PilM